MVICNRNMSIDVCTSPYENGRPPCIGTKKIHKMKINLCAREMVNILYRAIICTIYFIQQCEIGMYDMSNMCYMWCMLQM